MEMKRKLQIRWSDLDPNGHVRHSVYYDYCSQLRMDMMAEAGLTVQDMMKQGFGPVIFREEAIFRREINLHDSVTLNVKVAALRKDASRWTMRQEFRSYPENELKAIVTIEGAWLDIRHRKLLDKIPASVLALLDLFERTEDFEWLDN